MCSLLCRLGELGGQTPCEVIAVGSSSCSSFSKVSNSGSNLQTHKYRVGLAARSCFLTSYKMSEKGALDHFEHGHKETGVHPDDIVKHGDRVLSIIGDERVTLTDEEVGQLL